MGGEGENVHRLFSFLAVAGLALGIDRLEDGGIGMEMGMRITC